MYAVIKLGGNQHKAGVGDVLKVQKLEGEEGQTIEVPDVLMIRRDDDGILLGTPVVKGALVRAEILRQDRDKTILVYKFKRRKNYRRRTGHRQCYTKVRITEVLLP